MERAVIRALGNAQSVHVEPVNKGAALVFHDAVVTLRIVSGSTMPTTAFLDFDGLNTLRSTLDVLHAEAVFATLGEEVAAADVPALVLDGRLVFAYGYGTDLDIDEFTTLDGLDLWAWQGGHRDADPDQVERWGPFRVAPTTEDILTKTIDGPEPAFRVTVTGDDIHTAKTDIEGVWIGPGEPVTHFVDLPNDSEENLHRYITGKSNTAAIEDAKSIAHILDNLPQ